MSKPKSSFAVVDEDDGPLPDPGPIDAPAPDAPDVTSDSLTEAADALLEDVAKAEAADPRKKLRFVQFKVGARINAQSAVVDTIAAKQGTKLYIEDVAGVPCIVAEGANFRMRGFVPMSNVAAFGVIE